MKIGVIGTGQIGATLIRQYAKAGHQLKIANARNVEMSKRLEAETGGKAVALDGIADDIEVLVISIPLKEIPNLSDTLGKRISSNTIVIDTSNYYPIRDGRIDEIEIGMIESVWVSNQLSTPVIKVYNSILAGSLVEAGLPKGSSSRVALPISGDSEKQKRVVATLVNDSGFDPLDVGNLEDSWRQQPGAPVYCTDLTLSQLKKNIAIGKRELFPSRRDLALQFILKQKPEAWLDWWRDCVANNRKIFETDLSAQ